MTIKHYPNSLTLLLISLLLILPACLVFDDVEDEEVSQEENLEELMLFNQYAISYWRGIDTGRYQLQWAQHLSGVNGRYFTLDRYRMENFHSDEIWYFYYQNIYPNLEDMMSIATDLDAMAYRGIARILQAYSLGFMTDTWGDMPHNYAVDYFMSPYTPVYDEQDDIYFTIMDLLDQGIFDLQAATEGGGLMPGAMEDPIYGGDLDKWERAANAIRLRHLLRVGNEADDYSMAMTHMTSNNLFTGIEDNMVYVYDEAFNQENPHYLFQGVTRAGAFFVNLLVAQDDPRLPHFLTTNYDGEYSGAAPGSANHGASLPGPALASRNSPTTLICFAEQKFIEAELYWRSGQQELADEAYEEAVIASLRSFDIEDLEWEAAHAAIEDADLEDIINAKYIALFLNPEVWSDYRRTGYPDLAGFDGNEIPRRFLYPAEELQNNPSNTPENVDIYDRMWWDKE